MKLSIKICFSLLLVPFTNFSIPGLSHGGNPLTGTLTLGGVSSLIDQLLVASGVFIFLFIIGLSIWLIKSRRKEIENPVSYIEKVQTFSMNARLYILHIQGMSLTYGVRTILFNLYLLFLFHDGIQFMNLHFDPLTFIGVVLALGSLVSGIVSPFSGIIVDYIGKKWSFIMGDFLGAMTIFVVILFPDPTVIIIMQIIRSAVMSVHFIAEGPFIYEQSTAKERVHLFSVSSGMATLSSMSGNLIGGMVPLVLAYELYSTLKTTGGQTIFVLQVGLLVSVLLWLGSLIPAFFLKEVVKNTPKDEGFSVSARLSFKHIKHRSTVLVFVLNSIFVGLGAGLFVSFFSVFFLVYYKATTMEIAVIFALGALFIALGNFISPIVSERFGKVNAIVISRCVGIPFMLLLPLGPLFPSLPFSPIFLGGLFFLIRGFAHNATTPTEHALAMEVVTDAERTTMEALRESGASFFSAIGFFVGGYLMSLNDFISPFVLASILYFVAVSIFWLYFRNNRSLSIKTLEDVEKSLTLT